MPPPRALAGAAALALALAAAQLLPGALGCNNHYAVCRNAEKKCRQCSSGLKDCQPIHCVEQGSSCPKGGKGTPNSYIATCNMFNCNCDPCYGCGPGRPSGGNPSCNTYGPCRDVGGCDQECETNNPSNYKDGNCVACGPHAPTPANETCGDLAAFAAMPLADKVAGISEALCMYTNATAGEVFTTAVLAALDVSGDGALSCNEYRLSRFFALPAASPEAQLLGASKTKVRSVKLPKPGCKLSSKGSAALAKLVRQLKRPTRALN